MDKISNYDKSQILIDALPYIQKYNNKILVIKDREVFTNRTYADFCSLELNSYVQMDTVINAASLYAGNSSF